MPAAVAGEFFTAGTAGFFITEIATTLALNYVLGRFASKLAANKAKDLARRQPRDVTIEGTVESRTIIYGQIKTSGVVLFKGLSGSSSEFLWIVVALATHQCEEISDIWFDNRKIAASDIDGTGLVTAGTFANKVRIKKHLGTDAQTVDTDLDAAFPEWTSNHRVRGCTYIIVKMERDDKAFPTGAPSAIQALVKGKRVYDQRKDSTNGGSGSHRYTDPRTWEWSNNFALCAQDYLTGGSMTFDTASPFNPLGVRVGTNRVDWAYFAAAANKANEDVAIPPSSPATTQKRYTCDLLLSTTDIHSDNMEAILACGVASLSYSGGKYRLWAGSYDAPVHTITDDDLTGPIECMTSTPRKDRYNAVIATYWDENRVDQKVTCKGRYDSSYEAQDGERKLRTITLDGVRNEYRAQRICEVVKRKSRDHDTYSTTLGWNGLKIALWETANLQISEWWSGSRVARCIGWKLKNGEDGIQVVINWKEESASSYTDPLVSEYDALSTTSPTAPQIEAPNAPTSLVSISAHLGVLLQWDRSSLFPIGAVFELWEYTASTPFANATKIWEGDATIHFVPQGDTTTRYYWIRVRSKDGQFSATYPASAGIAGGALLVGTSTLDPNAATDLYLGSSNSSTGTGWSGSVSPALLVGLAAVSVPAPSAGATAVVTVTCVALDTLGTGAYLTVAQKDFGSGTVTYSPVQIPLGSSALPMTAHFEFSVPAGTAYTYFIAVGGGAAGSHNAQTSNVVMQVEYIYR